jgi:F-type H+-transporting ATPase subunit gamma
VRRAQARVLASRAYAEKAWEILLNVQSAGAAGGVPPHPLLTPRAEIKNVMIVLITSDRGLAGAYNANIMRVADRFADRLHKPTRYVTLGRKGRDPLIRMRKQVVAEFPNKANPTLAAASPIARVMLEEFQSGAVDQVFVAYTDFVNMLTQRPVVQQILPLMPYETEDQVAAEFVKNAPKVTSGGRDYEYEPNPSAILDEIVPRFTLLQLYQAILESQASELAARMVAMRNASENATALTETLTLAYNKARQTAITNEILDIVGGAEALQASIENLADKIENYLTVGDHSNGHTDRILAPREA